MSQIRHACPYLSILLDFWATFGIGGKWNQENVHEETTHTPYGLSPLNTTKKVSPLGGPSWSTAILQSIFQNFQV